jgi:hypothetical protein
MKHTITVTTAEEWIDVKAYGTYEQDYRNGEIWSWAGKLYYLAFIELSAKEQNELLEAYRVI